SNKKYFPQGQLSETALFGPQRESQTGQNWSDKDPNRPVTAPCETCPTSTVRPYSTSSHEGARESHDTSSNNIGNDSFQQETKSHFSNNTKLTQTSQLSFEDPQSSQPSGTFKYSHLTTKSRNVTGTLENSATSDLPTSRCFSPPYMSSNNLEQEATSQMSLETIPSRLHSSNVSGMRRDPVSSRSAGFEGVPHYASQKGHSTDARSLHYSSKNKCTESSVDNVASKQVDQCKGSDQVQYSKRQHSPEGLPKPPTTHQPRPNSALRKTSSSSSILKKTSTSSSLGGGNESSTTTKKVSLDLPPTICTAHGYRSETVHSTPDKPSIPFLSTAKLPLLFLDVKNVRVIIPVERYDIGCGTETTRATSENGGTPISSSERKPNESNLNSAHRSSERAHDCILLTLTSLSIAPQAENPLTRVELRSDLLSLAKKFAIDHVLGSQIEDRQYACEIGAISVNSGIWSELERSLLSHSSELELNAALLWNSGLTPGAPPHTLPLIREFRVTSTLAPCIVYLYENIVVAGTSLEINAAKDFCLSLTLAQLHLLSHLSRQLHSAFSPLLSRNSASSMRKQSQEDAGGTAHCFSLNERLKGKHNRSKVPFEMLLTGRSIVMELFLTEANLKPMLCLQLIQPDLLMKTNTLHQTKDSTLNVYDIKLFLNKDYEELKSEDDSVKTAMMGEDPKLEESAAPADNDSIEGDKARLNQLIRDKQARILAAQTQARVNQIHLLESLPLPERKRSDNGLIPVLITISLEKSEIKASENSQRLSCSINKPIRFILHDELITRFTSLEHKVNTALRYSEPKEPIHRNKEPINGESNLNFDEVHVEVDSREDRRWSIERVKHGMERWGLSHVTLNTDQMSFLVNHPESDLPGLRVHLAFSSVTLSHPFSCHLHMSNLSISTLFTSNVSSSHQFLVEPLDLKFGVQCRWESWYPSFLTYLTGDIETLSVNLSSNQLEVLHRLYAQYKRLLPNTISNQTSDTTHHIGDTSSTSATGNISSTTAKTNTRNIATNSTQHGTINRASIDKANAKPNIEVKGESMNTSNTRLNSSIKEAKTKFEKGNDNSSKERLNKENNTDSSRTTSSSATTSSQRASTSNQKASNNLNNPMIELPSSDQDQHYVDDLRAGAFQYIDVSSTPVKLPLSYQILFKHHSITWKYPNPRSITRLYIAPVPEGPEEANGTSEYFLQYYESSTRTFQVYTRFKIIQNSDEILKFDFLDVPPTKPVSDIWRIVHSDYVDVDTNTRLYGQSWQTERQHQGRHNGQRQRIDSTTMGPMGVDGRKRSTVDMEGNENNCELSRSQGILDDSQDGSLLHDKAKAERIGRRESSENEFKLSEASESVETYSCNMKLLLGSIRVDSFYSPKLISNLHIHLKNSVFKLNLIYCSNTILLKLNKRKLLLQKFTLNEANCNLFKNNDYVIAQIISSGNELNYNMNPNFYSGLYLTKLSLDSIQWNLINYNLLELKPILEVNAMHVNFYNAEYNSKKTVEENGMNIDLIVGNHVKLNVSNELVTTANVVKKLVAKTLRQMTFLDEKKTIDLKQPKTEDKERDCDTHKHINKNNCDSNEHTNKANSDSQSDTVETNVQRTKHEETNTYTDHEDVKTSNETLGLPVINLNELSDPFYHGVKKSSASEFQDHINNRNSGNSQNCESSNCEPCSKWESMLLNYSGENDKAVDDVHNDDDVEFMITTVMICNNTHIPFIVRQYDTKQESSVYSMECIYFSWPRSYNNPIKSTTQQQQQRHHWLEFNIKSVDFQWSSPLPLNLQTRGDHALVIQGPNERQFPVTVRVDEVENSLVLTIHGNIHCVNLTSTPLNLILLQGQGRDNQLIQSSDNTVSPSVMLNTLSEVDVVKYEMKMKMNECVWSGSIPIGANISKSARSGEDLWLVKLPLKPSPSNIDPAPSSRQHSFISVWLRLLWDYPNDSDLVRMVFVITPLYLIRSTLPCQSLVHVNGIKRMQWISGQGRLEELQIPDCTSQDIHSIRFQLTSHCEPATPPLQVSYRTVEQSATPYTELSVTSALELLYNYSMEVDGDDEYVSSNESMDHLIANIASQLNDSMSMNLAQKDATLGDRIGKPSTANDHQVPKGQIQAAIPETNSGRRASRKFRRKITRAPNIWESELADPKTGGGPSLSKWPFPGRYNPMKPTETVSHIDVKYCHLPLYNHTVCIYFRPWALMFNSLPVRVSLKRDRGGNLDSSVTKSDSSLRKRDSSVRHLDASLPESSVFCSLDPNSVLAPPRMDTNFWICLELPAEKIKGRYEEMQAQRPSTVETLKGQDKGLKGQPSCAAQTGSHSMKAQDIVLKGRSFQSSCSIELRSNQMFYTPKVSGLLYPNSFVYVDTFCEEWMAYTTLISSEYEESRVLNLCPSYTLANHSSYKLQVQGVAVYPEETGERYQIPDKCPDVLTFHPATGTKDIESLPLLFWKILGPYSPEVRPDLYLIFWYASTPLCPVLLWTLDSKRAHPLSISPQAGHERPSRGPETSDVPQDNRGPFGLSLTSHQDERGVQELLVWDNELPQLVFDNKTHVKLSVTPVYEDPKKCPPPMPFEWKWSVNPRSVGYYSLPEELSPESSTNESDIVSVMLGLEDPSTGSVSGELLVLSECSGRLLHLASTDFKVTIVKEVITQVITIELASSGEISAMDIRKRLALAFNSDESRSQQSSMAEVNKESSPVSAEQYYPRMSQGTVFSSDQDYSSDQHDPSLRQRETQSEKYYQKTSQIQNQRQNSSSDQFYPNLNQGSSPSVPSDGGSVGQTYPNLSHGSRNSQSGNNEHTHGEEVRACASEDKSFMLRTLSKYNFHVKSYVHQLNVCFLEDIHQTSFTVINLHKILHVMKTSPYRPHYHTPSGSLLNYKLTESSLCIHDIQLDNSAFQYGAYDFNVVLYKNAAHSSGNTVNYVRQRDEFENNMKALLRMRSVDCLRDFLTAHDQFVEFTVSFHSSHRVYLVDRVNVVIQSPFTLRIEDVYLSRVNEYWRRLLGWKRIKEEVNCSGGGQVLLGGGRGSVLAISAGRELAFPLYINSLLIEPFSLSLCLHTSSRFYIALDNSPLSFSRFERSCLVTSSFRLGQSVSLHYFLGAIYATGWAIGRLEFCGTPGGLASSVGTGIRDFLTLPYQALGSGPLGFFLGIYHGSGSLIRHTAA
ncbi:hypothetical protein WDU94_002138, partial [Cyamophila willieti]